MYLGLGLDERPSQYGSRRPFLTLRELQQFVNTRELPDSFVQHCLTVRWVHMPSRVEQFRPLQLRRVEVVNILRRRRCA